MLSKHTVNTLVKWLSFHSAMLWDKKHGGCCKFWFSYFLSANCIRCHRTVWGLPGFFSSVQTKNISNSDIKFARYNGICRIKPNIVEIIFSHAYRAVSCDSLLHTMWPANAKKKCFPCSFGHKMPQFMWEINVFSIFIHIFSICNFNLCNFRVNGNGLSASSCWKLR